MCHPYIILLYTSGVKNIVRSLTKKKRQNSLFLLFVCVFGFVLGWKGECLGLVLFFNYFGL